MSNTDAKDASTRMLIRTTQKKGREGLQFQSPRSVSKARHELQRHPGEIWLHA